MQCLLWYYQYRCMKRGQQPPSASPAVPTPVTAIKTVPYKTMILISVKDYNHFSQDYYDSVIHNLPFHQLSCTCGHSACLVFHAYYKRGIFLPEGTCSIRICRVRCSECGKTHALLLSSIVPYDRISLADQHTVICAHEDGSDCNAVCESNPSIDENSVKAIIRRYILFWSQRILSEAIPLAKLSVLVRGCVSFYSLQFMQIRRTAARLFINTT